MHAITRLSLRGLRYRDRRLAFVSAKTGREAVEIMRRQPGIAVILLDVVMESEHAGLEACRVIRSELRNPFVRILLRTGQPGAAPEKKVIEEYDIDGYLAKGELTSMRLYTAVRTSLKAHGELMDLEGLIAERTRELQRQKAENERLLLSILPPAIAERVRRGELRSRFDDRFGTLDGQVGFDAVALSAYIPKDRRRALLEEKSLPTRATGSVLFADITGFTPLTETLTEELGSRRGAEELTSQLDRVYGALIGEVHRYRGSVIGFSGDAITCWFEDDDGRRAVASALNMQRVMGWFAAIETPSGSILPLAVKAAVTLGPVRRLLIGDPAIQLLDVLAGSTLDRLALAASLAQQGEVVVGPSIIASLGDRLRLAARSLIGDGESFGVIAGLTARVQENPWPSLSEVPLHQARQWLLPPVATRLESGQGLFMAELRPTVALFLSFDGLDYDGDEDVGIALDRWIRWVQATLSRHGGSLIQLTTGDKGNYLYASFGAPIAYEDATTRALAAALVLRSPPPALSSISAIRIGLSQGRMRAGEYGSETRRTYGVLGDETNLAARLMSKAEPGQILVGERIASSGRRFSFRDLGHISVRGKRKPQSAFELLDRATCALDLWRADLPTSETVGRTRERRLLSSMLVVLAEQGEGGLAVLEGEAGIGKTHLVRDLVAEAEQRDDVCTVFGIGEALEARHAFYPWRSVLRQLAPEADPPEEPEDEEGWLGALRRAAARQTLLVVLEDAQWFDPDSMRLIRRLRYEIRTIMLVVTLRHVAEESHRLPQDPEVLHLDLGPLTRAHALTIAQASLGVDALPDDAAAVVLEKAEGQPHASEALALALRDQRVIEIENRACRLIGDPSDLRLPAAIERRVTSVFDAIGPTEQLTLKVTSVVGGIASVDLLVDIYPVSITRDELLGSLAMLTQLRLLVRESPEPQLAYSVRQRMTRDVAYDLLLHAQRRQLHRSVAEWYERHHADELVQYYPVLAHHWWQALCQVELAEPWLVTKAVDCLREAGEQALHQLDYGSAANHLGHGLDLLGRLPRSTERSRIELGLRMALEPALQETRGTEDQLARENLERIALLRLQLEQSGHVPLRGPEGPGPG